MVKDALAQASSVFTYVTLLGDFTYLNSTDK